LDGTQDSKEQRKGGYAPGSAVIPPLCESHVGEQFILLFRCKLGFLDSRFNPVYREGAVRNKIHKLS
jgi:hypothetical protein